MMSISSIRERRKNRWWGVKVSRAAFVACDLKLRPVKEKAAARALAALLDAAVVAAVVVPEELFEAVGEGALGEVCRLWTDSWRLFARAFSCWRINCAKDCCGHKMISQSFCSQIQRPCTFCCGGVVLSPQHLHG